MPSISVQFVFAVVVVVGSLLLHLRDTQARKCRQGNPAAAAAHNPAEFVHPGGVCWAPQNITDGPGV